VDVIHSTRERWRVSVVVPTLNEEATLGAVLDDVAPYADELIVVDGRSTDRTAEVARARGVRVVEDDGRGKGAAVCLALSLAAHPIVVFVDADGSHEARDIPSLVAPIRRGQADVVIGSRMTGGSDELFSTASEFVRLTGSMLINLAINYRWNVRLSDTQNGFRAVAREPIAALGMTERGTTIEQEMVMKALRTGLRVMNVPSHEYMRRGGVSKIDVKRVWLRYVLNVLRHVLRPAPRRRADRAPALAEQTRDRAALRTLEAGVEPVDAAAEARRASP
jgi:dolichol-phosphate mannosyltransferase